MNETDKGTLRDIIRDTDGLEARVALSTLVDDFPGEVAASLLAAKLAVGVIGAL